VKKTEVHRVEKDGKISKSEGKIGAVKHEWGWIGKGSEA